MKSRNIAHTKQQKSDKRTNIIHKLLHSSKKISNSDFKNITVGAHEWSTVPAP